MHSVDFTDAGNCSRRCRRAGLIHFAQLTEDTPSLCTSDLTGQGADVIISKTHFDPVHRGPRIGSNLRRGQTHARKNRPCDDGFDGQEEFFPALSPSRPPHQDPNSCPPEIVYACPIAATIHRSSRPACCPGPQGGVPVVRLSQKPAPVYRPRRPRQSPLYRIIERFFPKFEQLYPERYEKR